MTLDDLADLLKARGCTSVDYFHTDHFEPWPYRIDDASARAVERMARLSRFSSYGRRLSLFYAVHVPYGMKRNGAAAPIDSQVEGDGVVFGSRTSRQEELAREAIRPLAAAGEHEFHLHVHHEYWTRNHSHFDSPVSRWVNASSTAELDSARLELYVRLCKEAIGRELGRPFDRWAFIHGNWALNASDPLICHVDDELALLMRQGGFADFSFPAGRSYCDPKLKAPFSCLPLPLARGYDDARSDPRPIRRAANAMRPDRFFIWSSSLGAIYSSLDTYSQDTQKMLKEPERAVSEWLRKSPVVEGRLLLKTHAHSMSRQYGLSEPGSIIPHCHPEVVRLFDLLADACERARVELRFRTVEEIVGFLTDLDRAEPEAYDEGSAPPIGLRLDEASNEPCEAPCRHPTADVVMSMADPGPAVPEPIHAHGVSSPAAGVGREDLASRPPAMPGSDPPVEPAIVLAVPGSTEVAGDSSAASACTEPKDVVSEPPAMPCHDPAAEAAIVLASAGPAAPEAVVASTPPSMPCRDPAGEVAITVAAASLVEPQSETVAPQVQVLSEPPADGRDTALSTAIEGFVPELLSLHREWVAQLDLPLPAGDLYGAKVAKSVPLEVYELALSEKLAERFPVDLTRIVEIGAGWGGLAMLLARLGFDVLGFEGNVKRHAAGQWHFNQQIRRHPALAANLMALREGLFPEAFDESALAVDKINVCIATNITHSYSAAHQQGMIEAAAGFDELVLDLGRFGEARDTQGERDALMRVLVKAGFRPVERLYFRPPNEYWRLQAGYRQRAARARMNDEVKASSTGGA